MRRDQHAFKRRLNGIRNRVNQGRDVGDALESLAADIAGSVTRREMRQNNLPIPQYPDDLPISARREDIKQAIAVHQVVIVAGETGSGKTTQLPKICLEMGRGVAGKIGHTQPRRIAAKSLAMRIASELKSELGHAVGYKVRFSDKTSPNSYIKVMTDGILLAETQGDRFLEEYDTLIIDEAHERSLNIDFLLGYLKQLLPRRPDLKVIITSATIDTERFARHFGNAPVVEVSGRTYPVEVRYRPLIDKEEGRDYDLVLGILHAVDEIATMDRHGHILVFLPGEREIRETAEALRKHHPSNCEILPLYSRQSSGEQGRIFQPSRHQRIVLSTNVAETSLTVPGVRYVIDSGMARISRYSYRSKVQRLPIEPVSQASANQRKGRCGRIAPGVCIRLYSEEDFLGRTEYTEPEIQRTNLASVILQMKSLGLGDIENFSFIDPPDSRMIVDGYKLLQELGALDSKNDLTGLGQKLAHLPIDPKLGRMIMAASRENALTEVLVIVSALSIQDPRERPADARQAADERHRQFMDEQSDFIALLNIWRWFQERKNHLTRNKMRILCQDNFISHMRMLEWEDIHHQLNGNCKDMGLRHNEVPAEYNEIHRALLTGLLGNIGFKLDNQEYLGTRNKKFRIFPGSALFRKGPKWVMASELVETAQLYGRIIARIAPEWIEKIAGDLCKRSYADPHWEKKRAQVVASEKLTLYGLPVVSDRKVHYGPIDPVSAREIFIRSALVEGEFNTPARFFAHNHALIAEIEDLENKSRRRDVLVDQEMVFRYYDGIIPPDIYSGILFENWYKKALGDNPQLLYLSREVLMRHEAGAVTDDSFPQRIDIQGFSVPVKYHFDPAHHADGITAVIPLAILNQLKVERFEWLVPGMLKEKLVCLIKALPKSLRRNFVPAPDFAEAAMQSLTPGDHSLLDCFASQLGKISGVAINPSAWDGVRLPEYLSMNFEIVDLSGKKIAEGRDLVDIQSRIGKEASQSFSHATERQWKRENTRTWNFGSLPQEIDIKQKDMVLRGYPAIIDGQDSVAVTVLDSEDKAISASHEGLLRLFLLQIPDKIKYLKKNIPGIDAMCLQYSAIGHCDEFKESFIKKVAEQAFMPDGTMVVRDEGAFNAALNAGKGRLLNIAGELASLLQEVLRELHALRMRIKESVPANHIYAHQDIHKQLDNLVYPGFVAKTPFEWLKHYPRYLRAISKRLDKLSASIERDRLNTQEVGGIYEKYHDVARRVNGLEKQKQAENVRWMIEELRVSLFAQELKTAMPISVVRLDKFIKDLQ